MMYLDKIRTETRRFFKRGLNSFMYQLTATKEQKIINRILSNYDRIQADLAKDLDKLIINSSVSTSQNDNNFYSEKSSLYRNLLNCGLENNKNVIQVIIREIESQFRYLSIKADNLSFDFDKQEERKIIDEEINLKITSFTKNLDDYLKAILVYKHFNKDTVKQKKLPKPVEYKTYKSFQEYFESNLDFNNTMKILKKYQIINDKNEFTQKYIKPKLKIYVVIAKLIELDCILCSRGDVSSLSNNATKFFNIEFEYTQFNEVLKDYKINHHWKKIYDKLDFLDKEFNKP